MNITTRDLQARINALFQRKELNVDGMSGPATRKAIVTALNTFGGEKPIDLFGSSGLHRVHWHWTAGAYGRAAVQSAIPHYNDVFDHEGNQYDGGARPEHQANYDWRKDIGVSHTKNANTGAIGLSVTGMAGAVGWPKYDAGSYPLTWEGIDAMLAVTAEYCAEFDIPVSRWSTLSHAEVQPTLGIKQNGKWDFMVLPDSEATMDPVQCGDILRARMIEKFG